jgi:hypothetical protein
MSGGNFHPERKDHQVHLLCHDMTDIQDLYMFLQWTGALLVKSLRYLALLRNGDGDGDG